MARLARVYRGAAAAALTIVFGVIATVGAVARGQTAPPQVVISCEAGFGGVYRAGEWTPLLVTLQANTPRAATMELTFAHDPLNAMRITQSVSITAEATTLLLLAPLPGDLSEAQIALHDSQTGGTLVSVPVRDDTLPGRPVDALNGRFGANAEDTLIACAGAGAMPTIDVPALSDGTLVVGATRPARLPSAALGYDGLDVLLLAGADLARLDLAVQRAIVEWVDAGGNLLFWPAPGPLPTPAQSPLVSILPGTFGDADVARIDPAIRATLSLPARFAELPIRALTPTNTVAPIAPLGDTARGYVGRQGLGLVAMLPFDPSLLAFDAPDGRRAFWRTVLLPLLGEALFPLTPDADLESGSKRQFGSHSAHRQAAAVSSAVDSIGDIEGLGQFGLSWVVWLLLGLMILVGPVDWIVLKALGRQPWTTFTTAGWIGLFTIGAFYLGQWARSADLHLRSLELIDQVGTRVVAREHLVLAYAPTSARYGFSVPAQSWWRPATTQVLFGRSGRLSADSPFHQTAGGNEPSPARINIWSMRLLRGAQRGTGSPRIDAQLHLQIGGGAARLRGKLRNLGDTPLGEIVVATKDGSCAISGQIAPGGSLDIDRTVDRNSPAVARPVEVPFPNSGDGELESTGAHFWVHSARSRRVAERLHQPASADGQAVAVVFATGEPTASGPVSMPNANAVAQHRVRVRALVSISREQR